MQELNSNSHSTYQLSDIGCSAALVTLRFALVTIKKETSEKCLFVFKKTKNIEEAVNSYWMDELNVCARTYYNNIKMLKVRIHNF